MKARSFRAVSLFLATLVVSGVGVSPAQAQYFGKNKVQYRDWGWWVIQTDHFDVYHYESEKEAAVDAARMAERSYARLSRILQHRVKDKIPLVLYASHTDFQQSNITSELISEGTGGMTELAKRRVLLPFTGSYAELEHVLTHELAHAFQVDILYGRREGLVSSALGFTPPLWFLEGLSEYLSIGRVDELTQMWLRDAALQGYLVSVKDLAYVGDIRVYRFGQAIWTYIAEKYGEEKIGELFHKAAAGRSVDKALESVLGITMEKFSEDWTEQMRRTYLPAIVDHEKPSQFARVLTDHEKDGSSINLAPAVSPAGDRVAFISDRSLYNDIYLASAIDGKPMGRLVKGERTEAFESLRFFNTAISWSPDGRRIAFPAKIGGEDAIYVLDVKHKKIVSRLRFDLDGILSPTWSPDGRRIAFVGLKGGRSDLYITEADGTGLVALTQDLYSARDPQFSPDGKSLVFCTDLGPGTDFESLVFGEWRMAIMNLESGEVTLPRGALSPCVSPFWSPDGNEIAFISSRTGIADLYVLSLVSGESRRLTNILTGIVGITESSPALSVSRDGRRAVFTAFSRGGWDLFALKDPFAAKALERFAPPEAEGPTTPAVAATPDTVVAGPAGAAATDSLMAAVLDAIAGPLPGPRAAERGHAKWGEARGVDDEEGKAAGPPADLPETLPDPAGFAIRPYSLRFTPDYVSAYGFFQANVGIAGQTLVSFSDILGNHSVLVGASVYGSLADSDLLLAYTNLSNRVHYGASVYQFRNDFLLFTASEEDEFVSQIYRGAEIALSRPFSKFSRVEVALEGVAVSEKVYRQSFVTGQVEAVDGGGSFVFARPSIAYVHDNALWGGTGPVSGRRARLSVEQAIGEIGFTTLVADARQYVNVRQRYSFAVRLIGATSLGADPQRFRVGGPLTVRGLDYGELDGTRLGLANLEFRFPFIDELALGWPLPLRLRGVRGVAFFDAASAWEVSRQWRAFSAADRGNWRLDDIVASYGAGARLNLGYFVVRYDMAQCTDLSRNVGELRHHFAIGTDF